MRSPRRERRCARSFGVNGDAQLVLFAAHNFKLKGLAELIRASTLRPERDEPPQWVLVVAGP